MCRRVISNVPLDSSGLQGEAKEYRLTNLILENQAYPYVITVMEPRHGLEPV